MIDFNILKSVQSIAHRHEIGHSLGLSHPNQDPYNKNWNSSDAIMSLNQVIQPRFQRLI